VRQPFTPRSLTDLLALARITNLRNGVTGMLIHAEGSFLQVLEGPADAVQKTDADKVRDLAHQFRLGRWRQHVRAL
jgi:hypothetical protein